MKTTKLFAQNIVTIRRNADHFVRIFHRTIRHHNLLVVSILLFSNNLFSQTNSYDRHWYFGPYNSFDWISGSPVLVAGCAMNNIEGSATANNVNGNLLFYGGDDKIYNANHTLMPNSVGLNCTTTPKQGPISVQVPASANRYYYIYPGGYGAPLKYSIIDMTLQSGLGDIAAGSKNIQLRAANAEGIIAIRKPIVCSEYWIITHDASNNRFYIEQINSSGISNFSSQNIGPVCDIQAGFMDYSRFTGKLAMLYGSFNVALFDFNATTGVISNYVNVPLPSIAGCLEYYSLAFSPNGTKLYVAGGYGANRLLQVDLSNSNFVTTIAAVDGGNTLKLGPNGKIYGANLYTSYLGIVNNPNNAGIACNYVPNAINTGNIAFSDGGLPHICLASMCPPPLTVELFSFTAGCTDNNTIRVEWSTASQTNNDYFTIERSIDGISFETIGIVDGAGNSSTTLNYEYIDEQISLPTTQYSNLFYRLKQTDFDGQFTYADVIAVEHCHASSTLTIHPNPAGNELFIEIPSSDAAIAALQITDLLGKIIKTEALSLLIGNNMHEISLEGFSSGMYFVSIVNGETITKKFIKSAN